MTKGRIVLVPFPFDDMTASKVRPAGELEPPYVGAYKDLLYLAPVFNGLDRREVAALAISLRFARGYGPERPRRGRALRG